MDQAHWTWLKDGGRTPMDMRGLGSPPTQKGNCQSMAGLLGMDKEWGGNVGLNTGVFQKVLVKGRHLDGWRTQAPRWLCLSCLAPAISHGTWSKTAFPTATEQKGPDFQRGIMEKMGPYWLHGQQSPLVQTVLPGQWILHRVLPSLTPLPSHYINSHKKKEKESKSENKDNKSFRFQSSALGQYDYDL